MIRLVRQRDVLSDQHSYANATHVEAIEERLDVRVDVHPLFLPLVLIYTLCDCRDDTVVPPFDTFECALEFAVVVGKLWGPAFAIVSHGEVSS